MKLSDDLKTALIVGAGLTTLFVIFLVALSSAVAAVTYTFTNVTIWECTNNLNQTCTTLGQSAKERIIIFNDTINQIIEQQQRKFQVEYPSPYTA